MLCAGFFFICIGGKSSRDSDCNTKVDSRKDTGRWSARIVVNYKEIRLGCFDTKEGAIEAREKAYDKYFRPLLEC